MQHTKDLVSFNINSYVFVKLTKKGLEILAKEHEEYVSFYKGKVKEQFEPPTTNSDGYSEFQLWSLMSTFGADCFCGCEPPFETTVLFRKEDLDEI